MADKPFKFLKIKGGTDKYHPVDETARNSIGDLSQLETENKSNLVEAINEAAESGGSDKLFECTYDVTTFSEVSEAVAAGKICYLYKTASANVKYLYILEYIYPVTVGYQARFYRVLDNWQYRYAVYLNSNTGSWSTDSQPLSVWYSDQVRGKPTIGGVEVSGNKTLAQYGVASASEIGDLEELDTTDRSNLVSAINEVLSSSPVDPEDIQDAVDEYLENHPTVTGTFTNSAKNALIALLRKVAYIDANGETYLDTLINELFAVSVESITAVFTQGANVVYTNDSIDSLKQYLVVTANYTGGTSEVLDGSAYTLSGTLSEGTSTVTVTYLSETDTFTVNCTVAGWLYHFNESLLSSGSEDFNLVGSGVYDDGLFGKKCYKHIIPTSGTASTDTQYGIYAKNLSRYPNFASDFTVSAWMKTQVNKYAHLIDCTYPSTTGAVSNRYFTSATSKASGWSVTNDNSNKQYGGFLIQMNTANGGWMGIRFADSNLTHTSLLTIVFPSGFDTTNWHHYAVTRKSDKVMVFVDGILIVEAAGAGSTVYNAQQVAISTNWNSSTNNIQQMPNGEMIQDLYVAEFCKWETDFDPSNISY